MDQLPTSEVSPWGTRDLRNRWRVPPALLSNPNAPETLEGESILAEFPDASGLLLWECYRDVRLWVGTPLKLRRELFRRMDELDPAAVEHSGGRRLAERTVSPQALRAAYRLRRGMHSVSADDDGSMAGAALTVAAAVERAGGTATAIAFAQLSAAVDPKSATAALAVGRLARRLNYGPMAETWFGRTIGLARRRSDWRSYAGALTELGALREGQCRYEEAREEYIKAVRLARRRALPETFGRAVSALLRISLRQDDLEAAERYAGKALRVYRREHPARTSALVNAAELELRRDRHAQAAAFLREALPNLSDAQDEQVRALTLLVRAAAGEDDRATVEYAWTRALDVIADTHGADRDAARLLLALAQAGAEALEDAHADRAARRAHAYAKQAGDAVLMADCRAFLTRARRAA